MVRAAERGGRNLNQFADGLAQDLGASQKMDGGSQAEELQLVYLLLCVEV